MLDFYVLHTCFKSALSVCIVTEGNLNPEKYQDKILQPVLIPQSADDLYTKNPVKRIAQYLKTFFVCLLNINIFFVLSQCVHMESTQQQKMHLLLLHSQKCCVCHPLCNLCSQVTRPTSSFQSVPILLPFLHRKVSNQAFV